VFMVSIIKHSREREKVKRVQVTFTEKQWKLLEMFRGVMGNEDAEIVRNIILAWLAEKSVVASSAKKAIYIRQQGST
jgi:aryl-alcohol dehydrogenase-like predicted oxidoreductase